MTNDVFTLDENNNAAIRTLGVNPGSAETNSPSVFTEDENGNACIRVTGSGGGDSHNLGYYQTPEALRTAHPTATAGDFAIVNSTDTVWLWDPDTSSWKDGDTKGQVTSVNNQTGAVTLTASDVGALPDNTHIPADPVQADWDEADSNALDYIKNKPTIPAAQVNSDWNSTSGVSEILNKPTLATVATTGSYSDLSGTPTIPDPTQVSTMPTAGASEEGKIYQFIGTTDANYTNGYFYKCVSDGGNPATYSWTRVDVQPGSSLPSQTGNAGKFLTTDGTDASWSTEVKDTIVVKKTDGGTRKKIFVYNDGTSDKFTIFAYQNGSIRFSNSDSYSGNGTFTFNNGQFTFGTQADQVTLGESGAPIADIITNKINGKSASSYATITTPATMPELTVADWSSNTQTVNVTGVTASNIVFVSPAPASAADYASAGIVCTSQGAGTLTFTCTTVPTNAITVNVVIM